MEQEKDRSASTEVSTEAITGTTTTEPKPNPCAFDPGSVNRSEVSRALNVDVAHVSRVLNGQKNPSMKLAARMASYLGLSLDQFYKCIQGQQASEKRKRSRAARLEKRKQDGTEPVQTPQTA